jgi:hypothetical protein
MSGGLDNDGVPDDKDQCPFTQANIKVDAVGCPIELTSARSSCSTRGESPSATSTS